MCLGLTRQHITTYCIHVNSSSNSNRLLKPPCRHCGNSFVKDDDFETKTTNCRLLPTSVLTEYHKNGTNDVCVTIAVACVVGQVCDAVARRRLPGNGVQITAVVYVNCWWAVTQSDRMWQAADGQWMKTDDAINNPSCHRPVRPTLAPVNVSRTRCQHPSRNSPLRVKQTP